MSSKLDSDQLTSIMPTAHIFEKTAWRKWATLHFVYTHKGGQTRNMNTYIKHDLDQVGHIPYQGGDTVLFWKIETHS